MQTINLFFFLLLLAPFSIAFAAPDADDMFQVKQIREKQAIVEGKAKNLKAGDILYYSRPPYKFTIEAISGNEITLTLPENHSLTMNSSLVRTPSDIIKHYLEQENKLKKALED